MKTHIFGISNEFKKKEKERERDKKSKKKAIVVVGDK